MVKSFLSVQLAYCDAHSLSYLECGILLSERISFGKHCCRHVWQSGLISYFLL